MRKFIVTYKDTSSNKVTVIVHAQSQQQALTAVFHENANNLKHTSKPSPQKLGYNFTQFVNDMEGVKIEEPQKVLDF